MRFAIADPPYIGLARRYYGCPEVDHRALVRKLKHFDGWALCASSDSVLEIARILRVVLSARQLKRVRMLVWVKGPHPGVAWSSRDAYEIVFVFGGRPRKLASNENLDNVLLLSTNARQRTHPGALVGMKSAGFCEWLFRQLGACRGDELVDMFPGSGAVTRAWKMFQGGVDARRVPSRLADAQERLRERAA